MKRALFVLITSLFCFAAISAQETTVPELLGFSEDGRYLAFEIRGYNYDNRTATVQIQFVDVDANDFAAPQVVVRKNNGLADLESGELSFAALRDAGATFDALGIVADNDGISVHESEDDIIAKEAMFTVPGSDGEFSLRLNTRRPERPNCPVPSDGWHEPKIFTLLLGNGNNVKVLQADSVLYASRRCPFDYGIGSVHLYEGKIAIFLRSYVLYETVYSLIVTGNLSFSDVPETPALPEEPRGSYTRAQTISPEEFERYEFSEEAVVFDSGGLELRFAADDSTSTDFEGNHRFEKLVMIETAGDSRIIREVELPMYDPYAMRQSFFIADVYEGDRKLVLLSAFKMLLIYDATEHTLSELIVPPKDKPWIGVDGRSGNLERVGFSDDGQQLVGHAIHSGSFVIDISDPMTPRDVLYRIDFMGN